MFIAITNRCLGEGKKKRNEIENICVRPKFYGLVKRTDAERFRLRLRQCDSMLKRIFIVCERHPHKYCFIYITCAHATDYNALCTLLMVSVGISMSMSCVAVKLQVVPFTCPPHTVSTARSIFIRHDCVSSLILHKNRICDRKETSALCRT